MNDTVRILIEIGGAAVLAVIVGFFIGKIRTKEITQKSEQLIQESKEAARDIELRARDAALKIKQEAEVEISHRRTELAHEEDRIQNRRTSLDQRYERIEQRELNLNKRQSAVDKRMNEIEALYQQEIEKLQQLSGVSSDQAKQMLLQEVEKESRGDMARIYRQIEAEARAEGDKRAREIITESIQRVASDQVAQITSSTVSLPNEEMKGRIVGRNGRNIRAFEQAAGVDVIVDDTPEAVTISCFDPTRREIARRSLQRLIDDGRIHPAHIEKILAEEKKEVEKIIEAAGEEAAFDAGVGGLPPQVLTMLGRLKFRTSFGQNQLSHSVETARIAALLASELGGDVEVAKAAGLLHDIGKAMDHNVEGTHALIGAEFCKRNRVSDAVVNAIASHHHETEQQTLEAVICEAADAISGARPGARRENLEQYIMRLKALEEVANSYEGVSQAYAIQAGREVRIIVEPEKIDDLAATRLARDIAKNIEETMQYPGQIRVTVIREMRAVDFAK
jgi:ribonuclease Y